MERNKKKVSEWTAWDWFIYDVKNYLTNPLTWAIIILVLIVITAFIIVIIAGKGNQVRSDNSTFWTLYNLQTVLRNLK